MSRPLLAADPDELVRRLVRPGDHVHLAGTPSRPNALTYALCRVLGADGHLTVSTTAVHGSAHALALSGVADTVIAGFAGDTYPSPRPNALYEHLAEGRPFRFEAWSLLSYVQRLMAGAQGLPYAVTTSLAGTDLERGKDGLLHHVPDPADPGRRLTLLAAMRPDITMVHGAVADEDGNVALVPPLGEGAWAAYAARRGVLASVERVVSREELRAVADRVVIPGQRVLGVCEAPLGAHPQSLRTAGVCGVPGYLDDYAFLEEIVDACRGEARGADWYAEWVTGVGGHAGYLERLGAARRAALVHHTPPGDARGQLPSGAPDFASDAWEEAAGAELATCRTARAATPAAPDPGPVPVAAPVPEARADTTPPDAPGTRQERLIVLAARTVADLVRTRGYDTVLAGIGTSHMAAWLAAALLRRGGHDVKVVAELGMYGFTPYEGDVYLFGVRHAERAEMLAGIPEILGGMVAANPRALGVLAAAEIDASGAINTSRGADGRWLTGSGGANDIASTTDCVVVAPSSRRRYVTDLAYRTSPGDRVRDVVSDFGRFHRDDPRDAFRLTRWLPADDESADGAPAERDQRLRDLLAARTSWDCEVSGAEAEKPVTAEELALLRALDPEGRYR